MRKLWAERRIWFAWTALFLCAGTLWADLVRPDITGRDVRIIRDEWGSPHIFGKTDADAAFGLAYAVCEDDFATIEEAFWMMRCRMAEQLGPQFAIIDLLTWMFRQREIVAEKYATDLSPEVRAVVEAYADAVNLYASEHPEKVKRPDLFPITPQDIVVGFVQKTPFFFLTDKHLRKLLREECFEKMNLLEIASRSFDPTDAIVEKLIRGAMLGSNAFAIGPSRSADGSTFLAINSHQPWEGQVAWYEAHTASEEGLNLMGGTFPGAPIVLHGFTPDHGWAHTVNLLDQIDIYRLEINPENPNQYRFDGGWRDFETGQAEIPVKIGAVKFMWRPSLCWSAQGPVLRLPGGVFALRYGGHGNIRAVEQWYRMGKARNLEEFTAAMQLRGVPSFNCVYADRAGNVAYFYNALLPVRARGYDWAWIVPGNTSETLWSESWPWDRLPHAVNPKSGFVVSCNHTPFQCTTSDDRPKLEDYADLDYVGIETDMTNRGWRALELYGGDSSITEKEFYTYKMDRKYSEKGEVIALVKQLLALDLDQSDPAVAEARKVLADWKPNADADNPGTALVAKALEPYIRARYMLEKQPPLDQLLIDAAHYLKEHWGKVAVPWSDVCRLRRGDLDLPLWGGPDTLRAIQGKWDGSGHYIANHGDCHILMVTWTKDGAVRAKGIHQYGAAATVPDSPHYADQAPLFAAGEYRDALLDEEALKARPHREYRPGQPAENQ
ncbi:MAG TPA: penicillin acylase family protein [Candidatus Hydrogenedentes bacterium]|nr:penicillin acylase family protein [Candidatus Hydrogenedentota bacterium]